ncbi:hypothetical protein AQUCO_00500455v1 [Aquilegia coerulea]|uniref:Uncharacterized protein n=1 Tax=Aquilegia coerulea TaxID=218851 RepID=A0A2G5ES24_AQUCA|nr:hypothetical protein AQUCO_00500455v1 [Aquilegia coerulea]
MVPPPPRRRDSYVFKITSCHVILTFDLKWERPQVNRLPGNVMIGRGGLCLGVSEGNQKEICTTVSQYAWSFGLVLEMDAFAPKRFLKHPNHAWNSAVENHFANLVMILTSVRSMSWSHMLSSMSR